MTLREADELRDQLLAAFNDAPRRQDNGEPTERALEDLSRMIVEHVNACGPSSERRR